MSPPSPYSDFTELGGFVALPRVTSLAVSPDGRRVVAAVQQPDEHGSRYVSSLWELDPDGELAPRRITFSAKGESDPRFTTDGTLVFTSARPDPENGADGGEDGADKSALWSLPEHGEARVLAQAPGGLSLAGVADDGTVLASTSVLAGGSLSTDAERRKARKDRGVTAILHTGMPIRAWDHEVGDTSPRWVLAVPRSESSADDDRRVREVTTGADTVALLGASADLSPDGCVVATTWRRRVRGGETAESVVLIDVSGARPRRRTLLRGTDGGGWRSPRFSPDGARIALTSVTASSTSDTSYDTLQIHPVAGGDPVDAQVGDLTVTEYLWAPDSETLYVTGDLHSRGAVLAVDPATGAVRRTLADDAAYSSLQVTADGRYLYALRSSIDSPARPVRFTARRGGSPARIPAPGEIGDLPGRLEWVTTEAEGVEVGAWLCTPATASAKTPAPLMVWVHGGPHGSYNAWSWRWCPWLAVARGYAVLMPDPAMSTGYGHAGLNRGWPRRPDVVWQEVEALTDVVLRRSTLDGERTALLGASFGGFMTNWVAGQTDRFRAIVTHAGLYALDQQHTTTDAAAGKTRVHGTPAEQPEWYAAYSPHHHVARVRTPVLLTHGNRDYRVPVSEALRMWWDLVSRWPGRPADMPHRFLQLTSENHWVLSPSNARVWNQTVLDFCDHHVRGRGEVPDLLPEW
jgi:dipeptidyl aminopeptidase/acylaminoacyl peptidase